MNTIDKLDLRTPDFLNENVEKLGTLFPQCVTESAEGKKIDFDLLQQELSNDIVEGNRERYRLEWPGKREAIVTANLPTTKTLRPVREDSVDFDNTENLYIEGDNLEVLKLLQESYFGKIKMIYIDPPYNTGNDFVYKDNFATDRETELFESGQIDEYGKRMVANPETSGRYHSDWLTMMYPRLKLARNLLTDDGVIFISIDDNDVHNLRKVCDEVFGESNFIGELIWQKRKGGGNDSQFFAVDHEIILVFCKSIELQNTKWRVGYENEYLKRYREYDELGRYYWDTLSRAGLNNPIIYDVVCPDGSVIKDGTWQISKRSFEEGILNGSVKIDMNKAGGWTVFRKVRMPEGRVFRSIISDETNKDSSDEITELFGSKIFSTPKPTGLIVKLINLCQFENRDIILDFFSGSATTAHAVMQLNAEDGGSRKFIMVQLPEQTDEKSEAYKAGYKNICEIGKERIRRATVKVKDDKRSKTEKDGMFANFEDTQDYGFRVYRLADSNMQDVYYRPQDYKQETLNMFADNIKPDRTADDLLAQVILDWGLPLSYKIEQIDVNGKQVFRVAQDLLLDCFDKGIDEAFAKEIAKEKPLRVVFRDSGFASDTAKINVQQLLKQLSSEMEMKVI